MAKENEPSPHGMAGDVIRAARALTQDQQVVLKELAHGFCEHDGFNYRGFTVLAKRTMMRRARVRVVTRQLTRKGLAEYAKGLFTEDGQVAGAGYSVTALGNIVAQIISEEPST